MIGFLKTKVTGNTNSIYINGKKVTQVYYNGGRYLYAETAHGSGFNPSDYTDWVKGDPTHYLGSAAVVFKKDYPARSKSLTSDGYVATQLINTVRFSAERTYLVGTLPTIKTDAVLSFPNGVPTITYITTATFTSTDQRLGFCHMGGLFDIVVGKTSIHITQGSNPYWKSPEIIFNPSEEGLTITKSYTWSGLWYPMNTNAYTECGSSSDYPNSADDVQNIILGNNMTLTIK